MTPIVESWVSPAPTVTLLSAYYAHIRTPDSTITVASSHYCPVVEEPVSIACGPVRMALDVATARALGQQLIAAADHCAAQVAQVSVSESA